MFCVWLGDSGAYSIGRAYGRHKMAPRLSPKKSWEGYVASVFTGMLAGMFFVYAFTAYGNLAGDISIWQGAILGLILGALPPLGDLGESNMVYGLNYRLAFSDAPDAMVLKVGGSFRSTSRDATNRQFRPVFCIRFWN